MTHDPDRARTAAALRAMAAEVGGMTDDQMADKSGIHWRLISTDAMKHATIRPWPKVMNVPMDGWEAIVFTHGGETIRFTPQEFMAALRNLRGDGA